MTIYCVSHKAVELPPIDYFKLLQVGTEPDLFSNLRDNMGENIAHKNSTYSELTACLLYTSPSPRDGLLSRMPSSA